ESIELFCFVAGELNRQCRQVRSRARPGRPRLSSVDRRCAASHGSEAFAAVIEAFHWDTAPHYLLRDRDASYGSVFSKRVAAMGITEVVTAPRSPWQNAYVERVIGSIRRECLNQVVIFNERHLRHVLASYVDYYHRAPRTPTSSYSLIVQKSVSAVRFHFASPNCCTFRYRAS